MNQKEQEYVELKDLYSRVIVLLENPRPKWTNWVRMVEYHIEAMHELTTKILEGTKEKRVCGNIDCNTSTGTHGGLTFGRGKLAGTGYWEIPCPVCARAFEQENPGRVAKYGPCWPFSPKGETDLPTWEEFIAKQNTCKEE